MAWHKGHLSEQEVWEQVTAVLKLQPSQCDSLWLDGFKRAYHEKPKMLALLERLKCQGYTTALLSNIEAPLANYFKQHPFKHIDHCFYSCDLGMRKPEKGIYQRVLQELSCRPETVMFIDDRGENVKAAISLGITGVLFRDCDDLKEQLLHYHIRF